MPGVILVAAPSPHPRGRIVILVVPSHPPLLLRHRGHPLSRTGHLVGTKACGLFSQSDFFSEFSLVPGSYGLCTHPGPMVFVPPWWTESTPASPPDSEDLLHATVYARRRAEGPGKCTLCNKIFHLLPVLHVLKSDCRFHFYIFCLTLFKSQMFDGCMSYIILMPQLYNGSMNWVSSLGHTLLREAFPSYFTFFSTPDPPIVAQIYSFQIPCLLFPVF